APEVGRGRSARAHARSAVLEAEVVPGLTPGCVEDDLLDLDRHRGCLGGHRRRTRGHVQRLDPFPGKEFGHRRMLRAAQPVHLPSGAATYCFWMASRAQAWRPTQRPPTPPPPATPPH